MLRAIRLEDLVRKRLFFSSSTPAAASMSRLASRAMDVAMVALIFTILA
jgi:hypothetical protein